MNDPDDPKNKIGGKRKNPMWEPFPTPEYMSLEEHNLRQNKLIREFIKELEKTLDKDWFTGELNELLDEIREIKEEYEAKLND